MDTVSDIECDQRMEDSFTPPELPDTSAVKRPRENVPWPGGVEGGIMSENGDSEEESPSSPVTWRRKKSLSDADGVEGKMDF